MLNCLGGGMKIHTYRRVKVKFGNWVEQKKEKRIGARLLTFC